MTHVCESCGGTISDTYYRVFYPEDSTVDVCPHCPETNKESFVNHVKP